MALAGNIKEFGLADIFQIVSLQQKTGELIVESSKDRVKVLLEKGLIVGADANFRPIEERVEQSLVQSQQLSKFQLKRGKDRQKKTHQPLWTALAEIGELDTSTLQRVLSQQIHETIYHLLRWTEGNYRFEPKKSVEYDRKLVTPINTEFLIMEGFRITDEWSELEKEITSLQIVLRRNPQVSAPPANLSDAEMKVFRLLEENKTLQDLIDMSQLGEFDTCQTVYELIKKHVIEKISEKKSKKPKARQISFDVREFFSKAAVYPIGIGILIAVVFLLRFIPENFLLIHKPSLIAIESAKPFVSRAGLQSLSNAVTQYFLEYKTSPKSLNDLVEKAIIASPAPLTDPWGQEYIISTPRARLVEIRSAGKDGIPQTEDDIRLEIPL